MGNNRQQGDVTLCQLMRKLGQSNGDLFCRIGRKRSHRVWEKHKLLLLVKTQRALRSGKAQMHAQLSTEIPLLMLV